MYLQIAADALVASIAALLILLLLHRGFACFMIKSGAAQPKEFLVLVADANSKNIESAAYIAKKSYKRAEIIIADCGMSGSERKYAEKMSDDCVLLDLSKLEEYISSSI